ncbi:MAG: type I pullulanase [Saprospiraceae bacterium]|nr:type I pullulanase [Saprospiraceae bacterium]
MKIFRVILFILTSLLMSCQTMAPILTTYETYPIYRGTDLGLTWSPKKSVFKLWSPPAEEARILVYADGQGGSALKIHSLKKGKNGVWSATFNENMEGLFYAFQVKIKGEWLAEVPDPYAKAVGINGRRAMVVDPSKTDPSGWENDRRPPLKDYTDIVIYELHVRDLSSDANSGIRNKGKFLGLTETGTRSREGDATGLDHLVDLGITHVHLLPSYDYLSIDESKPYDSNVYNWGYDPQNYNVPEGSYATNAENGAVRIREFKQMVKTLHEKGIRVILDVVYNHTGVTEASNFNQLVPGYYYRQNEKGGFSDASACGNETASERPMMRKFIVESVKYWANEYHLDGFRFDLMGIHDMETMNEVSRELRKIDPSIFVYGEGWTAGASPLPDERKAIKKNTLLMDHVAAFSDDMRDGIKGHVFHPEQKGFVSSLAGLEESVKFGIVASTLHPQVDYQKVNYSKAPWAKEPQQTITYVSCHDNHTLWDRLAVSAPEASEANRIRMHKLAGAMVLTSQGVSFLHAGVELLRSKNGEENSYKSPDEINRIDWSRKNRYKEVYAYFKGLIALRKQHPAFRMTSSEMIRQHLRFLEMNESNLIAYTISGNANGDSWQNILVVFNGNPGDKKFQIPGGKWTVVVNGEKVSETGLDSVSGGSMSIPPYTAMVLYSNNLPKE